MPSGSCVVTEETGGASEGRGDARGDPASRPAGPSSTAASSGCGWRDIAAAAGVSPTLPHYYFKTRSELLRQAFVHAEARMVQLELEVAGEAAPRERLERLLLVYFDADPRVYQIWMLAREMTTRAIREPGLRDSHEDVYADWSTAIAEVIREGQRCGDAARRRRCRRGRLEADRARRGPRHVAPHRHGDAAAVPPGSCSTRSVASSRPPEVSRRRTRRAPARAPRRRRRASGRAGCAAAHAAGSRPGHRLRRP